MLIQSLDLHWLHLSRHASCGNMLRCGLLRLTMFKLAYLANQALKGVPTCYIFSCPQSDQGIPPFHSLVPYGSGREPGLILLSISGEARCWDSIGIGLAGGSHYSTMQLDISVEDYVTTFVRADVSYACSCSVLIINIWTATNLHSLNVLGHSLPAGILFRRRKASFDEPQVCSTIDIPLLREFPSIFHNRIEPPVGCFCRPRTREHKFSQNRIIRSGREDSVGSC
jgi:hypothetical protein